jgi:hypothetical protein
VTDSTTKLQDQKAPKEASNGEETTPTQESASGAKVPPPTSDPITTNQERYLNARFGDVLDQHAEFVHRQEDTKASPEVIDATPKARYLISERHSSAFHRAFHFLTPIKKDDVIVTVQDGILHITPPRASMSPPVKVLVRNDIENYPAVVA